MLHPQPSHTQQLLSTFRIVGVASLALLLGLSRAASAHARVPSPPSDPGVATVVQQSEQEQASGEASQAGLTQSPEGRWSRDTGIQLAEEPEPEPKKPVKPWVRLSRRYGPKIDLTVSKVLNPRTIPHKGTMGYQELPESLWRPDRLRDMTYTQFWVLISEGRIHKVKFSQDNRHAWVWTKETAPGGARKEKVILPYDPDLYPFLKIHNVPIEEEPFHYWKNLVGGLSALVVPLWTAVQVLKVINQDDELQEIFEDANAEKIFASGTTFKDIAGIDEVKDEMEELIAYLKDPDRFVAMGAKAPAGILFAGAPGTGKTLMARAIAGEAGVNFWNVSGTSFSDMLVGVGASRVRDIFAKARDSAPCIMFIDEFDAIGMARGGGGGADESTTTINQLLTEMDGFEKNTNVVIMAATNRPEALDPALTRPGRFDRILTMPLPNLKGRKEILNVHAKGRRFAEGLSFDRIGRATAGCTGADLASIVNVAAITAVRAGRDAILEEDLFDAFQLQQSERFGQGGTAADLEEGNVDNPMKRNICLYEAARCVIAAMTPGFDEISKVTACPDNQATGTTFFIPLEDALESQTFTRGYLESKMVVGLAGRCGEKLVLGEAGVSEAGISDLESVNFIAREMVYKYGFNKRLGPVSLMEDQERFLNEEAGTDMADMGQELASIALTEIEELVEAAEAKAIYGLSLNYKCLQALTERLIKDQVVNGAVVDAIWKENGLVSFPDPFTNGFKWDEKTGQLQYPGMPDMDMQTPAPDADEQDHPLDDIHPFYPYRVREDLANLRTTPMF